MNKVMIVMIFGALTNTVFATDTIELNSITIKDISKMSLIVPEVKPEIISPELQAKIAAQSLRKELKNLGIAAKVSVFQMDFDPTFPPRHMLAVEFANWQDFDKAEHLFQKSENGSLYYQGIEVSPRVPREKIPFIAKDAFDGLQACTIVNAVFVRQPTLKEAAGMLGPCMKAVSKKYGVTVSASQSLMPHTNPPQQAAPHSTGGQGIGILVSGQLLIGNPVLRDLNYSVNKIHGGYLLTWPAYVQYLGVIIPQ